MCSYSDRRYEREVGVPLQALIQAALDNPNSVLSPRWTYTYIVTGWYDMYKASQVERDTEAPFTHFLRSKADDLVQLGIDNPDILDVRLGQLREIYTPIAETVVSAFEAGGRFTRRYGSDYDGWAKRGTLLFTIWERLYATLADRLQQKPDTIGKSWALIVVELRRRKLIDERTGSSTWRNQCPFATDFFEAFLTYSLATASELMMVG